MKRHDRVLINIVYPLIIFSWAFFLHRYFFSGFILGDDAEEFGITNHILAHGPILDHPLHIRFGVWFFNLIFFKLFSISEATFFLPTMIMSSSLSVIGYYILLFWRYSVIHAFLAGLFIASAPFEILIGTVRANDLILSWFMALGLLSFVLYEKKPVLQGILVAFFWWFAFYVKLWVVYLFPALGLYYLVQISRERIWRGLISFSITSLFLHGIIIIFWKIKIDIFFPFITYHAATYPVATKDLGYIFLQYPTMIFQGSEFGTTLFGLVPYLLLVFLLAKLILSLFAKKFPDHLRLDRLDLYLFIYYGSFFLFLNFFPNSFKFDQYYSAPRIFRYLAPLSFPMTLHLAKLILDFCRFNVKNLLLKTPTVIALFVFLIVVHIYQASNATMPGQIYRKALMEIIQDVKAQSPPKLLVESWLSFFLRDLYLKDYNDRIYIVPILEVYHAEEYEKWLEKNQPDFPEGTMLITGLGSYVHYGAHYDGFRLRQFKDNLDPHWKLFKEYGMLSYLPIPEPARLWRWSGSTVTDAKKETLSSPKELPKINDAQKLFEIGMSYFDKNDYSKAQVYYRKIIEEFPESKSVDHALYFYAICYFRQGDWKSTIAEFEKLIEKYPKSIWVAGAHYHMGYSYQELNDQERAREEFQYVLKNYSDDKPLVELSQEQLNKLPSEHESILKRIFK